MGEEPLILPETLAVGALLTCHKDDGGMITFAGDAFFDYMQRAGLYSDEPETIRKRVAKAGMEGIYNAFL